MSIQVNHSKAEKFLLEAYNGKCHQEDDITSKILDILLGTHKTYKYILVNGILAKTTSEKVNPIALQVGADIEGSFDARSLCHKVLVPFERKFLDNTLGGSNEPFLNKPARFTHLSKNNAVRKGKDKEALLSLIYIFNSINDSDSAREYLACALLYLKKKITLNKNNQIECDYNPTLIELYEFSLKLLTKPMEGESSAILVATYEILFNQNIDKSIKVIPHKVNQSGASSKEIGDIDIFKNDSYFYSIEVKDKDFNQYDIQHAIEKVIKNSGNKAAFIYGINAKYDEEEVMTLISKYSENGFFILVDDIRTYIYHTLFKINIEDKQDFIAILFDVMKTINCKEITTNWVHQTMKDIGWIN